MQMTPRPIAGSLLHVRSWPIGTRYGEFEAHEFRNLHTHGWAIAMTRGEARSPEPLLARVHSSCVTSETFGGCDCDCVQQLAGAMEAIAREERGALFYLMQEGRGAGLTAKVRDRMLVQASRHRLTTFEAYERLGLPPDGRRYGEVSAMCSLLGIEAPLALLTNNPDKVVALEREKIRVHSTRSLRQAPSAFNRHYLKAKRGRGHSLLNLGPDSPIAEPPEGVRWMDPVAVPGTGIVQLAAYFLPVRVVDRPDPAWFRLSLYWDADGGTERVVLELESDSSGDVLVRFQPEVILERFPLRRPGCRMDWQQTMARFVEGGAGVGVFLPAEFADANPEGTDGVSLSLMERHIGGRRAGLLVARAGEGESVAAALRGVEVDPLPLRDADGRA
jgi:GTP cyclohydrolase II